MDTAPAADRAAKRADRAKRADTAQKTDAAKRADRAESVSLQILRRPEELRRELFRLQERRSVLWERCTGTGQARGGARVHASRNIRGEEDTLTALADTEKKIREIREELAAAIETAEALLDCLESMPGIRSCRDALLLRLRYMDGLNWQNIGVHLRRNGFPCTARNLFFWRDAALKQLDRLLTERGHSTVGL